MNHNVETLKDSLLQLLKVEKEPVSIGDISDILGSSAGILLVIVLATPMCLPFANIPGLAQAVSLAMGVIFYRYMVGKDNLWLPEKVKKTTLTNENLKKICNFLIKYIGKLEKYMHPRILFLTSQNFRKLLYLFCILMLLILSLPLVIPLTNFFPGLAVLLITFGIMQRDGCFVIAGLTTGVLGLLFIIYIITFGIKLVM